MNSIKSCALVAVIMTLVIIAAIYFCQPTIAPLIGLEGLVLFFFLVCPQLFKYWEKREYNNGVCPKCGKPLKYFDTDSGGNDGYMCENPACRHTVWLGWFNPKKK